MSKTQIQDFAIDRSRYDDANPDTSSFKAPLGLTKELVIEISKQKNEPDWMLQKRLQAFEWFKKTPMPNWGPSLAKLDLNKITYFVRPGTKESKSWEEVPEDIKNTFDKLGIPEAEKKALGGVGAQYDCLTQDTLVYTNPKGAIKIKDIKADDTIFAYDEKLNQIVKSKVRAVLDKGKRAVFELKVAGRTIKATFNHPFLALADKRKLGRQRARFSKEWKYLNELNVGDLIAIATDLPDHGKSYKLPKIKIKNIVIGKNQTGKTYDLDISNSYNKIDLPKKTNEDLMWFLGLYIGDGSLIYTKNKDKAKVQIATPEAQKQLREELVKVCKRIFNCNKVCLYKDRIIICSTILVRFLEKIGFKGKANTKSVPDWVLGLPKNEKLAFLGGYLDSDGAVRDSYKSKDVFYTSINEELLKRIKEICIYCGLQTSKVTTFHSKHPLNKKRIMVGHRLHVSGDTTRIKSRYDFKKSRLFNKHYYAKFNSAQGTCFRTHCSNSLGFAKIESIKYKGIEPVYDISVENYRNFVAEGIIVHNSDIVYHSLKKEWEDKGVIFENMDVAVQKYPELVKKYFMTKCIPINDHKFIMLHAACWSGGTFIYIPPNVKVEIPLQAYFRMNAEMGGQFEHTLIIADKNSEVHYVEGCSSPRYSENSRSLHAGCVELFVHENAIIRYSSVENWSKNTLNLNTKRAIVEKNGKVYWLNGNNGSQVTMLYPCSVLVGEGASSDSLGIAFAGPGQNQDTGSKVIHAAPRTNSIVRAKSISKGGGISSYRGYLHVAKNAANIKSSVECDALLIDDKSTSNTYPSMKIDNKNVDITHEARIGKIGEEEIFYLMSRGLSEEQAVKTIVAGFIEPVVKQLPLEYAVELNKLIELEMSESVG